MSMEINGAGARPPVDTAENARAGERLESQGGSNASAAAPGSSSDTFNLTNKATQLQQLESQIATLPVVDTQRVQDVQHAIATNTLQSEPAEVADKLLTFEAGLAQPASG